MMQHRLVPDKTVNATFVGVQLVDGIFPIYIFTNICDLEGKKYSDKYYNETKLLKYSNLEPGKEYQISMQGAVFLFENEARFPYPIYISDGVTKYFLEGGNAILKEDQNGDIENLSEKYSEKLQYKKALKEKKYGNLDF